MEDASVSVDNGYIYNFHFIILVRPFRQAISVVVESIGDAVCFRKAPFSDAVVSEHKGHLLLRTDC